MRLIILLFSFALVVSATKDSSVEIGKAETIRYVRAHTEVGLSGPYEDFFNYAPDLSLDGIDNAIKSACTTGLWIFYEEANYEGVSCTVFGISSCFDYLCPNEISSLRYAGNPDGLNGDYFNLYEDEAFVGTEFRSNVTSISVGDVDQAGSSLIISGTSAWTFFTGVQFSGTAVCVIPSASLTSGDGTVIDYFLAITMADIDLPDNSIRSVLKGCLSDRVVSHPRAVPHRPLGKAVESDLND